jgi:hypothetical protein
VGRSKYCHGRNKLEEEKRQNQGQISANGEQKNALLLRTNFKGKGI